MFAINVMQPHAFYMFFAGKDVENRSWMSSKLCSGDKLAIVASKKWHPYYEAGGYVNYKGIASDLRRMGVDPKGITPAHFLLGGLIGVVTFNGVTRNSPSKWAETGQCHWLLSDPKPLPFMAVKGRTNWRI